MYDAFPVKKGLEQGDALSLSLSSLVQNMPLGGFRQPGGKHRVFISRWISVQHGSKI
jgi:hypothetical protein